MLTHRINNDGLVFAVNIDEHDINFSEWKETDDSIYYFPLLTLVDNGNAIVNANECIVPFTSIYLLDDYEKKLLGIPDEYSKYMRLRGNGMLNSEDFFYTLDLMTAVPDGEIISFIRKGNIVSLNNKDYLLSEIQYKLMNEIERYNQTNTSLKTINFNLHCFAEIKQLALEAKCNLDSYLANENVYAPSKLGIEIAKEGDDYTIMPKVDIAESAKFTAAYDRTKRLQDVYPVQKENGERVRVVLSQEQKESLIFFKEKKNRFKSREEIREIIQRPTEYFDPEQFDLSEFYSDRVIEIGVYKPKFYPFVSPYKSCWVAGATVECPESGSTKVMITDEASLRELESLIEEATNRGEDTISYKNTHIGILDAKFLARIARKQLESSDKPIHEDYNESGTKVLIIEENANELGFSAKKETIKASDKFTLFRDLFLNESFRLKSHQEEGIAWLQHLYKCKASGCLMADDMGLGKTLQILYFIDWHYRTYQKHKPYLIVAPVSLLDNWENEYNRFFMNPHLHINRLTSHDVPRQFNKNVIDKMQKMDIILTNYESLRISQLNFCAVEFDVAVLDEAQKIKSPGTLVTNASKALNANFKIAMTGTPVENSLLDLWCIMDFCVPGLLGNAKDFAKKYQNPLKNEDTDILALGNEIHDQLGLYFMRRLKQDVAKDLPKKIELKESVEMPALQQHDYVAVINRYIDEAQKMNMLVTINCIRTISEHPYLYDSTLLQHETEELIDSSARLIATIKFLDNIKLKNEKVILFAERKDSQKMLQKIVYERYGLIAKIINGDTPSSSINSPDKLSRQASIDEFQSIDGFNAIIMSPIAAGMGLNVTGANHVIHYSRHWNPAKENQATDRTYRIGQTKDVYVYYPMATSKSFKSFDVNLDDLLSRKTALATSTIFPTDRIEVTPDELGKMLFTISLNDNVL